MYNDSRSYIASIKVTSFNTVIRGKYTDPGANATDASMSMIIYKLNTSMIQTALDDSAGNHGSLQSLIQHL